MILPDDDQHEEWRKLFAELFQDGGMEDWAFIYGQAKASIELNQQVRFPEEPTMPMRRAFQGAVQSGKSWTEAYKAMRKAV